MATQRPSGTVTFPDTSVDEICLSCRRPPKHSRRRGGDDASPAKLADTVNGVLQRVPRSTRLRYDTAFVPGQGGSPELDSAIADMKSEFAVQGQSTVAALSVGGRLIEGPVHNVTQNDCHAEEVLIEKRWAAGIDAVISQIASGVTPVDFTIVINRSPCPRCADALNAQLTAAKRDPRIAQNVRFRLAAIGVYEPGEDVNPNIRREEELAIRERITSCARQMQEIAAEATQKGLTVAEMLDAAISEQASKKQTRRFNPEPPEGKTKPAAAATRLMDLISMEKAGWELLLLDVNGKISRHGAAWEEGIENARAAISAGEE